MPSTFCVDSGCAAASIECMSADRDRERENPVQLFLVFSFNWRNHSRNLGFVKIHSFGKSCVPRISQDSCVAAPSLCEWSSGDLPVATGFHRFPVLASQ